jgi:hypothetical protein
MRMRLTGESTFEMPFFISGALHESKNVTDVLPTTF